MPYEKGYKEDDASDDDASDEELELTSGEEGDLTVMILTMKARSDCDDTNDEEEDLTLTKKTKAVAFTILIGTIASNPNSFSWCLILRAAPFLAPARIRQNAALLRSRPSSSSATPEQQPELKSRNDSVFMTENCVRRMKELQASEPDEKMLRLSIEAGGCSGLKLFR
ncbi:hypothetical protein DM860_012176 [Cuscuta australis]|uniref:FeS cluster biogenesis domain-containing protein n=1 Tax=Cuscuta australis TaxID=267555 RepID=A0A328EAL5_9ASTE|nr:hypothetical protein DM860_012176 [Cuscuta australis]